MNIKWSYYLIAGIYALLIVLRIINYFNEVQYRKENSHCHKVFSIKRDFFTTVTWICIIVTIAINGAAIVGGKSLNTESIVITLLVIGFTMINSFTYILFSQETSTIFLLGYCIKAGDVQSVKSNPKKNKCVLNVTFTKEIESYNYLKLNVFGKKSKLLAAQFEKLIEK